MRRATVARHDRDVTIRRAFATDAAVLAALCLAWGGSADSSYERRFADWYASSGHLFWLAEVSGTPVGFADLEIRVNRPEPGRPTRRWGYLDGMYVLEAHRGHGLGTGLLAAVLEHAEAEALSDVVLHPTAPAVSLYRRAGFEFVPGVQKEPMRLVSGG